MFGSHFRDFVSEDTTFDERLTQSCPEFGTPDSGDSGNCSETEEVGNPVAEGVLTDNSLIGSLIGNIGEGNKSFIIEDDEEESFVTVPKNLTIIKMIDILNNSINDNNPEKLDKIVNDNDIDGYVYVIDLNSENFKNFCIDQLNLKLEDQRVKDVEVRQSKIRSDHQHIYSSILSMYKHNMENGNHDYSVKELVLLAIAANDKLTERYKEILFNQENSILLSLLVGGQKYIEIFTEKFHEIYTNLNLKEQIIKTQCGQVNFFSVIALRKEQAFLQAVLVEYVLKDLIETLQTSNPDPLYGVFETASLVKNEPFITMVLDIFEKRADHEIKKDLLARSIVNLLGAAMDQEHVSIVEYLCQRYIRSANSTTYSIYEHAFADDKVILVLKEQILKNINARSRKKIYDLVLQTASRAGNIEFITKVLELIENSPQLSNGQNSQALLQNSLITILGSAVDAKSIPIIKDLCMKHSGSIIKALENKEGEEVKKLAAKNILNNVEKLVQKAVEAKDVSILSLYINVVEASLIFDPSGENLSIVDQLIQILTQFAREEDAGHGGAYPTFPPGAEQIYAAAQYATRMINGNISDSDYKIVQGLIPKLKRLLESKQNTAASPVISLAVASVAASSVEHKDASTQQINQNVLAIGAGLTVNSMEAPTQQPAESNSNLKEGEMSKDSRKRKQRRIHAMKMSQNGSNKNGISNSRSVKLEGLMLNNQQNNTTSSQAVPDDQHLTATQTSQNLSEAPSASNKSNEPENQEPLATQTLLDPSSSRSEEDDNRSVEEPVCAEIHELVNNMVETVSNGQATLGNPEDSSSFAFGKEIVDIDKDQSKNRTYADALKSQDNTTLDDKEVFEDALDDPEIITSPPSSPIVVPNDSNHEEDSERESVADSLETHAGGQTEKPEIVTSPSSSPTVNHGDSASANARKSKRSTVVTPLALTGVAMGSAALVMYFAFQVSVLTVGILAAMGAFCIAAALIANYFPPSNSLEDSNVTQLSGNAQGV